MMKKRELLSPDVMQVEGAALRALLDERGYGVKIAAAAAGVGTTGYLSQILNAVRPLNLEVAIRIAALLNAAIDRFSPRLANFARTAAKYVDSGPTSTGQTAPSSKRLMIARQDDASYAADWPFGITIDVARWKRLRPEHQRVVIDFVAARVAEFEAIYALDARAFIAQKSFNSLETAIAGSACSKLCVTQSASAVFADICVLQYQFFAIRAFDMRFRGGPRALLVVLLHGRQRDNQN